MKSAVETLNPTRVKLEVEVPLEELKPEIDKAYKSIATQIQVPGFRKGKVPSRLIDQRVGRGYVIETAINEGLNGYYQQAVLENELVPLSRPEVEISELPDPEKNEGQLKFHVEIDVRPTIELPDYKGLDIEVDAAKTSDDDVQAQLDELRGRFGTLKNVDRPTADGDYITIDLGASVEDEEVDSATGLSYLVGSGTMLDGLDEAVIGLSADEDATFTTALVGGEHAGKDATVKVKVTAVKERELPEANDDFAQLASEFDTMDELMADLKRVADESKVTEQGIQARDKVMDRLVEIIEVPVPESVIEEQVASHFGDHQHDQENDHDTPEHRAEVRENTERAFRNEIILDAIAEKEEIGVEQAELIEYIVQASQQYGIDPNQFAQMLDQQGQVSMMVGEVRRRKALAHVLELAAVKDTEGNEVDLTTFVRPAGELAEENDDAAEVSEETEEDAKA
ncbi:trigger factor [Neomicrococcus lactis]|uniref:Trigger factor n=1 Tax=Neomicrococcus lactis TaxID=732241 RepID=A0A7W9DB83_9MICC|nr:trigger factor [Neomicrococcus lactis]